MRRRRKQWAMHIVLTYVVVTSDNEWPGEEEIDAVGCSAEIDAVGCSAEDAGRRLIEWFNETLRPHECSRRFVSAVLHNDPRPRGHDWEKTSLMTQVERRGFAGSKMYDAMRCKRCGVTGRRYGLGQHGVKLDGKHKKYEKCNEAMDRRKK